MDDQVPNQQETENNNNPPEEKHYHAKVWVPVLIIVALAVVYLGVAYAENLWPFASHVSPPAKDEIGGDEEGVDEMEDWQTYRNEEYGFEFKFPGEWVVQEDEIGLPILANARLVDEFHGVRLPSAPGGISVNFFETNCRPTADFVDAEIGPGNMFKTICRGSLNIMANIWPDNPNLERDKDVLNQILSSFRFIPSTELGTSEPSSEIDTSVRQTYTNAEYGYSFQYSQDLHLIEVLESDSVVLSYDEVSSPENTVFILGPASSSEFQNTIAAYNDKLQSRETIIVAGRNATKLEYESPIDLTMVFVPNGENYISIWYSKIAYPQFSQEFSSLLASFRF